MKSMLMHVFFELIWPIDQSTIHGLNILQFSTHALYHISYTFSMICVSCSFCPFSFHFRALSLPMNFLMTFSQKVSVVHISDVIDYNIKQKLQLFMPNLDKSSPARWKIRIIFVYQSSFGDRDNFKLLKQQNFRRFLIDSETVRHESEFPLYDIAFRKVHHSGIQFQEFLDLIPELATIKFKGDSRKGAFQKYMQSIIEPLYAEILGHSQFGRDVKAVLNFQADKDALDALENCAPIKQIYEQYIDTTSVHPKNTNQFFNRFCLFLRDFQVSPRLICKSICYVIFITISSEKDGKFTLEDLKTMIICISEVIYNKDPLGEGLKQATKLSKLLQCMEISLGFAKMFKTQSNYLRGVSFLKQISQLEHLEKDTHLSELNKSVDRVWMSSSRHKNCSNQYFTAGKPERKHDASAVKKLFEEENSHLVALKRLFTQICIKGEAANDKTLKSFKIKKIFERMKILKNLSQTWMDITIADLCRTSPSGKVEFTQFVGLLSQVAEKLNITPEEVQQIFLKSYPPVEFTEIETFSPTVLSMISHIEKTLQRVFEHYSKSQKFITFSKIFKIAYDFEIFPSILSKTRLYQIFTEQANRSETQLRNLIDEKTLTLKGFQRVLIVISHEISMQDLSEEQKLIILLQKMNQSAGYRKVLLGNGLNLVSELRNHFNKIYMDSFSGSRKKHVTNFDELIEQYGDQ